MKRTESATVTPGYPAGRITRPSLQRPAQPRGLASAVGAERTVATKLLGSDNRPRDDSPGSWASADVSPRCRPGARGAS
jgi:hypothetical protein